MNSKIREIEQETLRKEKLDFNVGDSVKVHNLIREGEKERVQIYEGVVLKRQGGGNRETFTVRKNSNGVGVEKTFPVNSPMVVKVEVIRKGKARRAKLNYLRERIGKSAKVKENLNLDQGLEE
ncbi:MAG: 50S ribosomal protein L19 [Lachnospiraceae bacterium]|nr:50S ribosomal protein L19 [Lachnospiraceae bacterium]